MIGVGTGEYRVVSNGQVLETGNVSTCVVGAFYDEEVEVRGLAHGRSPGRDGGPIPELFERTIEDMLEEDAETEKMEVYLVGGSQDPDNPRLGFQNLSAAKDKLEDHGIEYEDYAVCGDKYRDLVFKPGGEIEIDSRPMANDYEFEHRHGHL